MLPVLLHSTDGSKHFPLYAIPDSGADTSCFPEDWADVLGFDLKECAERPVLTGAGMGCHYESADPLMATVGDRDIELCACFGPIPVGLLGRDDFFRTSASSLINEASSRSCAHTPRAATRP